MKLNRVKPRIGGPMYIAMIFAAIVALYPVAGSAASDVYSKIGATPKMTFAQLKTAYPKAVLENHPDFATDASDRKLRNKRLSKINQAWNKIYAARKCDFSLLRNETILAQTSLIDAGKSVLDFSETSDAYFFSLLSRTDGTKRDLIRVEKQEFQKQAVQKFRDLMAAAGVSEGNLGVGHFEVHCYGELDYVSADQRGKVRLVAILVETSKGRFLLSGSTVNPEDLKNLYLAPEGPYVAPMLGAKPGLAILNLVDSGILKNSKEYTKVLAALKRNGALFNSPDEIQLQGGYTDSDPIYGMRVQVPVGGEKDFIQKIQKDRSIKMYLYSAELSNFRGGRGLGPTELLFEFDRNLDPPALRR